MKKISILMFLFSFSCATLQPAPEPRVYDLKGLKKEKIFQGAAQYVAEKFNSANDVIQYKNSEEGKIICKGITSAKLSFDLLQRPFYFTWIIEVKDEKIRIEYNNISAAYVDGVQGMNYDNITKEKIDAKMESMANELLLYIRNTNKKTDW